LHDDFARARLFADLAEEFPSIKASGKRAWNFSFRKKAILFGIAEIKE
jgi:hypothetical protein